MSTDQRDKWNRRYAEASLGGAAAVVRDNAHLLPTAGDALDLACGLGANALLLARRGLRTQAWDIADTALARLERFARDEGLTVTIQQRDVEAEPPPAASFDVIVVSRFLYRPLCPALEQALRPGGLLFYQTFSADKPAAVGPANPDYLLGPNELLRLFPRLLCRAYREEAGSGEALYVGQAPA